MNDKFLEEFYEKVILPRYVEAASFNLRKITWKDHGKVGLDAWAHYFDDENGKEYVLLYEDFPDGAPFSDELSHQVVKIGDKLSLKLDFDDDVNQIPNITGYFTLYKEK